MTYKIVMRDTEGEWRDKVVRANLHDRAFAERVAAYRAEHSRRCYGAQRFEFVIVEEPDEQAAETAEGKGHGGK